MAQGQHEDTAGEWTEPADAATTSATEETLGLRTSPLPGRGPGCSAGPRPSRPSAGVPRPRGTLPGFRTRPARTPALTVYRVPDCYFFCCFSFFLFSFFKSFFSGGRDRHPFPASPERDARPQAPQSRRPAERGAALPPAASAPGGWVPPGGGGRGGAGGRRGGRAARRPPPHRPPPSPVSVFLSLVGGGGNGGWWVVAPAAAAVRDDEFLLRVERGQPGRLSL